MRSAALQLMKSFAHGGNVYRAASVLGLPPGGIIDFSASINPLGPPPRVRKLLRRPLPTDYPDPEALELRLSVADVHGLDLERIVACNGSTELIYLLPRALKPERVLMTAPTFSEYRKACDASGAVKDITVLQGLRSNGYAIDPDEFVSAMRGAQMAFLCNPNNPTGTLMPRHDVLGLARAAERERCMLVVDEAFMDFCPDETVMDVEAPNLIVLRSLTKFHGLAALRVGFGVMPRRVREKIEKVREPWTVNSLAQASGAVAVADQDFAERTSAFMQREKAWLARRMKTLGISVYPSAANYLLLNFKGAMQCAARMLQEGILVRGCANFNGLGPDFIRVAVKSHRDNTALIEAMKSHAPIRR